MLSFAVHISGAARTIRIGAVLMMEGPEREHAIGCCQIMTVRALAFASRAAYLFLTRQLRHGRAEIRFATSL